MKLALIIIIGIILAYLIYHYIHRLIIRRATSIVRNDAQATTESAMTSALNQFADEHTLSQNQNHFTASDTVADVWGRGVMAFEFSITVDNLQADQLPTLRRPLNNALGEYAVKNHVKRLSTSHPTFVVTDLWLFEGQLHIDVAYLMNESTIEYVQDLKRLNPSEKMPASNAEENH
ncbi:hypothetical protein [Furfurilactobacillus milii]|uniref:Uncharacterized protein n=1 Tax=Furfurilactobacillus rossiae TaxID=231049 RepID=A0A7C9N5D9_9LACO|nr:hypothetical protein [Furfurilactobacillus milii]MYV04872.1 hypothetical protein [Furfurilactobacillus milii]